MELLGHHQQTPKTQRKFMTLPRVALKKGYDFFFYVEMNKQTKRINFENRMCFLSPLSRCYKSKDVIK